MVKNRILISILIIFISFGLVGCNYVGGGISTMVKPPNFSTDQSSIYKALKESIRQEENITLVSPQNGKYKSAVIEYGIDSEPTKEAIVFYKSGSESTLGENNLRVCLLDQYEGKWRVVWDIPGEGSKVDKVLFLNDGISKDQYVIIGFIPENKGQNTYSIYNYKSGMFKRVDGGFYQMMELFDIDQDGIDDFITVGYKEDESLVSTSNLESLETTAAINRIENGKLKKVGETDMSGRAISYENIHKDTTSFGKPALIIDEQVNKNTYATEVLVYEEQKLKNLVFSKTSSLFEQTLRQHIPICYDIDGDGIVEIPKATLLPGYTQSSNSPVYLTSWRKLKDGKLLNGIPSYVNYSQGYGLLMPEGWEGKVSAKSVVQNNEIEFFVYKGNIEDNSEKLLDLKIDTLANSDNFPAGFTKIDTVGQVVYLAKVYDAKDKSLSITIDQVKKQLVKMYINSD